MMVSALTALALVATLAGPGDPPARSSGWLARLPDGAQVQGGVLDGLSAASGKPTSTGTG